MKLPITVPTTVQTQLQLLFCASLLNKFDFHLCFLQYHEVMGYLVGSWLKKAALFFNVVTMGSVAVVQIIACVRYIFGFSCTFILAELSSYPDSKPIRR